MSSGPEQLFPGGGGRGVNVRSGTPEGGLISPLLFVCPVRDLTADIQIETLTFVDDVKKPYRQVDDDPDVNFTQAQLSSLREW